MHAGTWKIIGGIPTCDRAHEYVVLGYDPDSPTPYGTWNGVIKDGYYDFNWGNYFKTKEEAVKDMIERAKKWL